jgi:hypothetical protein
MMGRSVMHAMCVRAICVSWTLTQEGAVYRGLTPRQPPLSDALGRPPMENRKPTRLPAGLGKFAFLRQAASTLLAQPPVAPPRPPCRTTLARLRVGLSLSSLRQGRSRVSKLVGQVRQDRSKPASFPLGRVLTALGGREHGGMTATPPPCQPHPGRPSWLPPSRARQWRQAPRARIAIGLR